MTTESVAELFCCNERLICYFETEWGQMAVIFVGALLVAGIHTVWLGQVNGSERNKIKHWDYTTTTTPIYYAAGEEIGYFNFGSTVIVLVDNNEDSKPGKTWNKNLNPSDNIFLNDTLM